MGLAKESLCQECLSLDDRSEWGPSGLVAAAPPAREKDSRPNGCSWRDEFIGEIGHFRAARFEGCRTTFEEVRAMGGERLL